MLELHSLVLHPTGDLFPAFLKMRLVLVDQHHIIHVSDIVLDVHPFLDQMVQIIQDGESYELAGLASKCDPYGIRISEAVDDVEHGFNHIRVFYPFCYRSFGYMMRYRSEKALDVQLQHPTVYTMLSIEFIEVRLKTVSAEIDTFAVEARTVVINETVGELVVQPIIAQGALEHAVTETGSYNLSALRFGDEEADIGTDAVLPGNKILMKPQGASKRIPQVFLHGILPPYAFGAFLRSLVELLEGYGILIGH